jgi:hypothetical protein
VNIQADLLSISVAFERFLKVVKLFRGVVKFDLLEMIRAMAGCSIVKYLWGEKIKISTIKNS